MDPQAQKAIFAARRDGDTIVAEIGGNWCMRRGILRLEDVGRQLDEINKDGVRRIRADQKDLLDWDSTLLALLQYLRRYASDREWELECEAMPDRVQRMMGLATAVAESTEAKRKSEGEGLVDTLGRRSLGIWNGFLDAMNFVGEAILSLGRFSVGRARIRWKDFWLILQDVSVQSLPIVALISFLVGLIIAFLGAVILIRFGAEFGVAYLVGYGMLREMGAIMTGVIIAGRTGAAFAAQIGSMKVTEEIDALRTLGISPIDFIVLPRLITLILMMPLLVVYANIIGIFGGFLVAILMLDIAPQSFFDTMLVAVDERDFWLGIVKAFVFGIIIAISGCLRGLQSGSDADSVGVAATRAVVTGITLIVVANAIIDWLAAIFNI